MKRIALFLITNLAVVLVLSVTLRLLGVEPYLQQRGFALAPLLMFAAVLGMGGAFISLAISKWAAKPLVAARVIETPSAPTERWLVDTVRRQAQAAGIGMPEVAIFETTLLNAFATGMNKNKALVAVSTGLLGAMNKRETEAVLGHEITHIANGDMVTLALIQGVVNTFVIVLAQIVGGLVDQALFKTERDAGPAFFITYIAAELILGILASLIVMAFSRQREFRADQGGAKLAGRDNMIAALQALQRATEQPALPDKLGAFGIAGGQSMSITRWFMTHPPLAARIAALRQDGSPMRGPIDSANRSLR